MEKTKKVEVEMGGKQLLFESGVLAKQASGAVTTRLGDAIVFCAATASDKPREGVDFLPLQVEYREKFYAAGRFPGGYFKREGRPSEREILTSRATDRPIRPLFPKGYFNEVQLIGTLLCADGETEPDILCINAASAALTLSEIPFRGPIGAVRVGRTNGQYILNPTHSQIEEGDLNLTYVGSRELPLMIEGDGDEISEPDLIAAMRLAQPMVVKLIDAQLQLRREMGLPDKVVEEAPRDHTVLDKARERAGARLADALSIPGKLERQGEVDALRESLREQLQEALPEMTEEEFFQAFDALEIEMVRRNVVEKKRRIDGRAFDELRPIDASVGFLPRTHGSALFTRGETQALATVTLGTTSDAQSMDALSGGPGEKRFMLHYNFPPYSVGEVGRIGFTGRREIGHGHLAERSLQPVLPEDYPYTVRIVSEIMESNGSSSMASVCAGCLALMDAGVPIRKAVAGVSIGLFTGEGEQAEVVTDIIGAEDHCGDMDFKVAGTQDGITGYQVDLKLGGLRWELVERAFEAARVARLRILDAMSKTLAEPRAEMSSHAPRIHTMRIDPDKIGLLIGPGGKNIRRITDTYGVQIDIEDSGEVNIFSASGVSMEEAIQEVKAITAEAEVGKLYQGRVTGVKDFGAFVEILPGKDGLVHISELADYRVKSVSDICKIGDQMWVKCISIDEGGKIRLSRKEAMAELDAKHQAQ